MFFFGGYFQCLKNIDMMFWHFYTLCIIISRQHLKALNSQLFVYFEIEVKYHKVWENVKKKKIIKRIIFIEKCLSFYQFITLV